MNCHKEIVELNPIISAKIYMSKDAGNNNHYPLHWHDSLEFDLMLNGSLRATVNGESINVRQGEFLFINSGDLHETHGDDKKPLESITILLSYELLREYCPEIDLYYFDFSGKNQAQSQAKQAIIQCAMLHKEKSSFYELEISIVLRNICRILFKECMKKKEIPPYHLSGFKKHFANIKKAIKFMEENYTDEISLKIIAEEIGMSPNYFSRFFKETTGETYHNYLMRVRLYHAHLQLLNSDASITEIALNNGFPNIKSFIECFKKIYGLTPAKYKNQRINK